ncbi:tyrosine-type recombinase/integrase [Klebsiella quasipneumoniae]|uniref:tyrosine-type recombinase/integrase n=1 Tax=Klebsiella quasipneumoniae TaxID=1463165 RepID=UPI002167C2BB|nr:integrase family protein [Klebsiella quasipneumoniae]MCS4387242.1 integrase family protein [Klebsiella quasipneumoniae subsp. similipneumoniae]MCS4412036.1 integrase family protein [Klebsiella quasipneumoniae subsp. similipneumoniae]HDH1319834.1 integrase family protein [Klebsiella quasipneumoniae subsp. similipneumoniae]HDU6198930.1 integrase family protein [Klebsiella quasipneumoniae subsp. similipneumoniae]
METFKFTKSKLESLPPADSGQVEYGDTVVNGLRVRVGVSGVKSFCISRKRNGKFIRATLGRFPDLTIDNARAKALELLGDVATTGKNPNVERRINEKASVTLADALNTYIESRDARLSADTAKQYRSILQNYSGDWMKQPIASISRERVETRHKAVTDGSVWFGADKSTLRAGVGTGSKAQADLWARVLRAICRFAHDHYRDNDGKTLLPDPPTMVLSTKRKWHGTVRKTERIRTNELGRWFSALSTVRDIAEQGRDDIAAAVCDAVEMAIFTGLRKSEILELSWDRVNLGGRYFWIDTTKNGDPLELPVTETLLKLFRRRAKMKSDDGLLVFPGDKGVIKEYRHIIERISAATVPEPNPDLLKPIPFKWHDGRRTFGTVAELVGVGNYILKRLLNHRTMRSADVTQGYLHFSADELMEPASRIERAILEYAGIIESHKDINTQLMSALENLSEEEKRKLIFAISNDKRGCQV